MIPGINNINIEEFAFSPPEQFFSQFALTPYAAILTGKGPEDISRYSFIGVSPGFIISYNNGSINVSSQRSQKIRKSEFWEFISQINEKLNYDNFPYPANLCGAIGYIPYDSLRYNEKVPKTTVDSYFVNDIEMVLYNKYFVFDRLDKQAYEITVKYSEPSEIANSYNGIIDGSFSITDMQTEGTKQEYIEKVKRIQEYILEGDVYEVNLSRQVSGEFSGNPYSFFMSLYNSNPAPYSAYLNFGDTQIISNSPELFLHRIKDQVETRPIKGTTGRGKTSEKDEINRKLLLDSPKDQAELYMIIDLLRNDLGRVCEYGSVKVIEKKKLEAYENVYHLVGIIRGRLKEGLGNTELLQAAFPGGSITGCPKVRCMEIIDELETYTRHIYTGSVFIMNRSYFNSSIAIRTSLIQNGRIFLNSGGAITIDSDPESEYRETEDKISNFAKLFGKGE